MRVDKDLTQTHVPSPSARARLGPKAKGPRESLVSSQRAPGSRPKGPRHGSSTGTGGAAHGGLGRSGIIGAGLAAWMRMEEGAIQRTVFLSGQ